MTNKEQHILFILDRSGSMSSAANDVIGGFNTYIKEMQGQAVVDGLTTIVSLVTFADDHKIVFAAKPVGEVRPIDENSYRTMGSTALLDTVYESVSKYREHLGQGAFAQRNAEAPPVLTIIFTDGEENASTKTSWEQVQNLIQECEALGNWTFTYVGAHAGAWAQATRLNLRAGNVLDAKDMTIAEASSQMIQSSIRHRAAYRDHGQKSSNDLFGEQP